MPARPTGAALDPTLPTAAVRARQRLVRAVLVVLAGAAAGALALVGLLLAVLSTATIG